MAEVFAAYETNIKISKLESYTDTTTITDTSEYVVNNLANRTVFPIIEIIANGSVTLNSISNNSQKIVDINSLNLSDTDIISLDFENQIYKLNNVSIINDIDFTNNKRLKFIANIENTLEFNFTGTVDINIIYNKYQNNNQLNYIRNLRINTDNSFNKIKKFNSNKINYKKKNGVTYSFSFGKLSVNWDLYDKINSDDEFMITYYEKNEDTYEEYERYLVGVTFDRYDKSFNESNGLIIQNSSGDGMDILEKEYL
jgi:hypothetical protein